MRKMKKWICLPVFMMLAPFAALIAQQEKKPNILFIAVDDLKPILGCYGDKLIKTPNIDRLRPHTCKFDDGKKTRLYKGLGFAYANERNES